MGSVSLIGAVGWAMLVLPELHFIYKQLIPALGEGVQWIRQLLLELPPFGLALFNLHDIVNPALQKCTRIGIFLTVILQPDQTRRGVNSTQN